MKHFSKFILHPDWKKLSALSCFFLFFLTSVQAQKPKLERMDPPNWWTNMQHDKVQILLYGSNLGGATVTTDHPSVKILKVNSVENPNYLFVDVEIPTNSRPGAVNFQVKTKGGKVKAEWKLLARSGQKPGGFSPADLVYLLMPDRFSNGDPTNDVVKGMKEAELNRNEMYKRHGGDLQGIINKLDYLKDLGVTAVWPCPIITNDQPKSSYHGYAITDYYAVDPRYGTIAKYRELCDRAHQKGMKIIMDYVHNHCGSESYFFKDLPMKDWVNQHATFTRSNYRPSVLVDPNAANRDKFLCSEGWFDHHMPDLNQRNPYLASYLIQNNIWWVETAGIDGYRFDTYPYPDQDFLSRLNAALLKEYPTLSIVGEVWEHSTPTTAWFHTKNKVRTDGKDSNLPSLTDFPWLFSLMDGLNEDFGWKTGLNRIYYTLSQDELYKNPNQNLIFLDNHDLSRIYSEFKEDLPKLKLALTALMTMRGTPQIYYGTEILMKNFAKPDGLVREDFPGGWPGDPLDKFNAAGRTDKENEAFNHLRTLAQYRKSRPSLYGGKMVCFIAENETLVYFRVKEKEVNMMVLHTGKKKATLDLTRFQEILKDFKGGKDILSGKSFNQLNSLELDPVSSYVIELQP